MLTGLDDEHLGTAAVAAGAQDYLVKGKADGEVLVRAIRYAVERRRAEASLLRLREEQLARPSRAASSAACCRRPCWPAAPSGRTRSTARDAPAR